MIGLAFYHTNKLNVVFRQSESASEDWLSEAKAVKTPAQLLLALHHLEPYCAWLPVS